MGKNQRTPFADVLVTTDMIRMHVRIDQEPNRLVGKLSNLGQNPIAEGGNLD